MEVECAAAAKAQLGEGAFWDPLRQVLWWLDIRAAVLHCHRAGAGTNLQQPLPYRLTALALAKEGTLVACGDHGFVRLHVDDSLHVSLGEILGAPQERPGNRFNDGKVDAHGRFWAGTMDDAERGAHGSLYRLDPNGTITCQRTRMHVPNGPCFLADGTMLITDSAHRLITAVQMDEHGAPLAERDFARFTEAQGYPDGMSVDVQNHIWIAFWDGACLRRLNPHGEIVGEIALPVQRPTCPTFGGPSLEYLYLTTATVGIDPAGLASQTWSGSLLRLRPGVRGRAVAAFRG